MSHGFPTPYAKPLGGLYVESLRALSECSYVRDHTLVNKGGIYYSLQSPTELSIDNGWYQRSVPALSAPQLVRERVRLVSYEVADTRSCDCQASLCYSYR
jgi:hypothetical protein